MDYIGIYSSLYLTAYLLMPLSFELVTLSGDILLLVMAHAITFISSLKIIFYIAAWKCLLSYLAR